MQIAKLPNLKSYYLLGGVAGRAGGVFGLGEFGGVVTICGPAKNSAEMQNNDKNRSNFFMMVSICLDDDL